ncbi:MAG: PA domain-containing protein [Parvularculaceae bacterium]
MKTPNLLMSVCSLALIAAAPTAAIAKDEALEAKFDKLIDPAEMNRWLETMAAEPNHVGSPHNKANAEMTLKQFQDWGWEAKIETYNVLYPTPLEVSLDLLGDNGFSANVKEPPVEGDEPTKTDSALPAYLGYQGDGDVSAPLVYVNYGMPDDYETLKRMGVDVKGKIVIARYGAGWRGLKPKLAQEHGAVGCIIYSDPHEDGYAIDDPYPKGASRPPEGLQRGSVMDMPTYPGDPLTPGRGRRPRRSGFRARTPRRFSKFPPFQSLMARRKSFSPLWAVKLRRKIFRGQLVRHIIWATTGLRKPASSLNRTGV